MPRARLSLPAAALAATALLAPSAASAQTVPVGGGTVTVLLSQLSPVATTYTLGPDFGYYAYDAFDGSSPFSLSATGTLFSVSGLGCDPASFAGFVPGSIALVDRGGGCLFAQAAQNAQAAGAIGVLFVNNIASTPPNITGDPDPTVPVAIVSQALGTELRMQSSVGTVMTLSYSYVPTVVPEPATLALTAGGLALLGLAVRRRRVATA